MKRTYESEVDSGPATTLSVRPVDPASLPSYVPASPLVRSPGQATLESLGRILGTPAPVPARGAEIVQRERMAGADERSTPQARAWAALIRSLPVCGVCVLVGCTLYIVTPIAGGWAFVATVVAILLVMAFYNWQEYRFSSVGIARQSRKLDHQLEMTHEQNRHAEAMTAMQNDHELKMKVLEIARGAGRRLGGDHA